MADSIGDAFLQSVFKSRELAQQQKLFGAELQFKQMQAAAENQLAQQRINNEQQYQQGILGNDKTRTDIAQHGQDVAEKEALLRMRMSGAVSGNVQDQPGTPQGSPLTLGMSNTGVTAPAGVGPAAPMHTPDSVEIGGQFVRAPLPAELQAAHRQQLNQVLSETEQRLTALGLPKENIQRALTVLDLENNLPKGLGETGMNAIFPKPPTLKEGDEPLTPAQIEQWNAAADARHALNFKGQSAPPWARLGPGATKKDLENAQKNVGGFESAFGLQQARDQSAADRRVSLQQGQDRLDNATNTIQRKVYQPSLDNAERFNTMTDSYVKAMGGDQQAMLSLLANHIGMTMGLQKGARITQGIYHEAIASRPALAGIQAHFDKDGYLSGVVLTPKQMQEMVANGADKFSNGSMTADSLGTSAGVPRPAHMPNTATKLYYLQKTGGDKAAAEQLMQKAGWTVSR